MMSINTEPQKSIYMKHSYVSVEIWYKIHKMYVKRSYFIEEKSFPTLPITSLGTHYPTSN